MKIGNNFNFPNSIKAEAKKVFNPIFKNLHLPNLLHFEINNLDIKYFLKVI